MYVGCRIVGYVGPCILALHSFQRSLQNKGLMKLIEIEVRDRCWPRQGGF